MERTHNVSTVAEACHVAENGVTRADLHLGACNRASLKGHIPGTEQGGSKEPRHNTNREARIRSKGDQHAQREPAASLQCCTHHDFTLQ